MKDMILKTIKGVYNCYTLDPFESYVWMPDVLHPIHRVNLAPNQRLRNILLILRVPSETLEHLMGLNEGHIRDIVNEDTEFSVEDQVMISEWLEFGINIFAIEDVIDIQATMRQWAAN